MSVLCTALLRMLFILFILYISLCIGNWFHKNIYIEKEKQFLPKITQQRKQKLILKNKFLFFLFSVLIFDNIFLLLFNIINVHDSHVVHLNMKAFFSKLLLYLLFSTQLKRKHFINKFPAANYDSITTSFVVSVCYMLCCMS